MRVKPRHILKDLIKTFRETRKAVKIEKYKDAVISTPVVISASTLNQFHALKPLIDKLGEKATHISENPHFIPNQPSNEYYRGLSFRYAINQFFWFYTLPAYQREVYRSRYYNYYKVLGQYRYWLKAFKKSNAKYYIAANDHSGLSQIGFVAARDAGLKTIYVQHAAISDLFPPLMVDYALLDGQDAKQKYLNAGPTNAEIHLIGTMKYDPYLQNPELNQPGELIGICIGTAAHDIQKNIALCHRLEQMENSFCLRFHPVVDTETRSAFTKNGWPASEPEKESALDFIFRCHTVISGDSTILLEASVLKRRPLYFASDGIGMDYYGFLKAGVLDKAYYTPEEVTQSLDLPYNIDAHRKKAKIFCNTLYTPDEGHSTDKAIKILEKILKI